MYKEETKNHHSFDSIPYTCDVAPANYKDTLLVRLTYYCGLRGIIDPNDLIFYKLESRKLHNLLDLTTVP